MLTSSFILIFFSSNYICRPVLYYPSSASLFDFMFTFHLTFWKASKLLLHFFNTNTTFTTATKITTTTLSTILTSATTHTTSTHLLLAVLLQVGLPAKSGVSGCVLLVVPNTMGICLWSPPLDSNGNSCRGVQFCMVRNFIISTPVLLDYEFPLGILCEATESNTIVTSGLFSVYGTTPLPSYH